MLYILYYDANENPTFEAVSDTYTPEFETNYRAAHPKRKLVAILNADDDMTTRAHNERIDFVMNCSKYGFRAAEYRAKIKTDEGIGELYGFNPRNRKYPCLVRLPSHRIKTTADYARKRMVAP